jgi:inosine/xanthosine triphosphatase
MKTIIVASKNPVKVQAARAGFTRMFPGQSFTLQTLSAPSEVSDQPFTSAETLQGAYNRARNARVLSPQADFWIGIEGGVDDAPESLLENPGSDSTHPKSSLVAFAWVVVLSGDHIGKGQTGVFYLPPQVAELVHQGKELGEADDIVFGRTNSKQENGAVGLLTGNVIDRAAFYEQAVILALIPFQNPELY